MRSAEDAGFGLFGEARPRIAVDRPPADAGPADRVPRTPLDDLLPCAVRALHDPRPVILEPPWQTFCPQFERKVHQPAMAIRGYHAKSFLHRAFPLQRSDGPNLLRLRDDKPAALERPSVAASYPGASGEAAQKIAAAVRV